LGAPVGLPLFCLAGPVGADIFPVWNCKLLNGIIDKAVERYKALDDNAKASIGEDLDYLQSGPFASGSR
jgi:hypothetical protein